MALLGTVVRPASVAAVSPRVQEENASRQRITAPDQATREVPIDGNRLGGFVLPILPVDGDLSMSASTVQSWKVDDTQRLILRGNVTIDLASYAFSSNEAQVWINRLPSEKGLITQVAIFFLEVAEPTRRAGLGVEGNDLLVTASTMGKVRLDAIIFEDDPVRNGKVLVEGRRRLANYLRKLVAERPELRTQPLMQEPVSKPEPPLVPGGSGALTDMQLQEMPQVLNMPQSATGDPMPIFRPDGIIGFHSDDILIDEGTDSIIMTRSLLLDYYSNSSVDEFASMKMTADRGVLLLKEGTLADIRQGTRQVDSSNVTGIYLAGNVVVEDPRYMVRGREIYYDIERDQAIILDALLRTYPRNLRNNPLYARASEMRQVAANEWKAENTTISRSEFFTPHLSIGAGRVTITEPPDGGDTHVKARNVTLRAGRLPFFYWPYYSGDADEIPLRSIGAGYSDERGVEVESRWGLFQLLGIDAPEGMDADLEIDGYSQRGVGVGSRFTYNQRRTRANLQMYGLWDTGGNEKTSTGREVEIQNGLRGYVLADASTRSGADLLLQGQVSYISDPTYMSTWRQDWFYKRRMFETSAYIKNQSGNSALAALLSYDLNSFISNSYRLASRPYVVNKAPDLTYRRYGDSFFKDTVSWSSEYGLTAMQLLPTRGTPNELGIRSQAFGSNIGPVPVRNNTQIPEAYEQAGYRENWVYRLHTRQELSVPLDIWNFNIVPFGSLSLSHWYKNEFDAYSEESQSTRVLAAAGTRFSTQMVREYNGIQNLFLDINRIRHIIEPNAMVWYGYNSTGNGNLPVYDQEIEGISGAAAVQAGLKQTFQTKRGGPGAWSTVDLLTIDFGGVFNSSDGQWTRPNDLQYVSSPTPRFYKWRPELSQWGNHLYGSGIWALSNTFNLTGSGIWITDDKKLSRGSAGVEMNHSPDTMTYVEYRYIEPSETELLQLGLRYQVGPKYELNVYPQYDLRQKDFRAFNAQLTRTFPDFEFGIRFRYDNIEQETSVGAKFSFNLDSSSPSVVRNRFNQP